MIVIWLSRLFSPNGTIDRLSYAVIAFVAFAIKHNVDRVVAARLFGVDWTMANYWLPFGIPVRLASLQLRDYEFLALLAAMAVPFVWVGVVTTLKRLRAVAWPLPLVVLFFVPVANVVLFALLCAVPDAMASRTEIADRRETRSIIARFVPADRLGALAMSVVATGLTGLIFVLLGTVVLREYGWGVFVAMPFCQGALSAICIGAHRHATVAESLSAAIGSVSLTALLMLALAFEGVVCIVMALPLALGFACIGAVVGYNLQQRPRFRDGVLNAVLLLLLAAPCVMAASALAPEKPPLIEVSTAVDINAPAETVWKNVLGFPELPAPTQVLFRVGIAYPKQARIVGHGVGAIRYCEFSTGSFVEPIVVWDKPRLLRFDVTANPPPMRELSMYPDVNTPHLTGFLQAQMGEFKLVALGRNRTRLVGTTWYTDRLWPQAYWELLSDPIIHAIHDRVLHHIKAISEGGARPLTNRARP